jgi:hypothetical protein
VTSRDLVAVTDVALSEGVSVALLEQPYRVAGVVALLRLASSERPARDALTRSERSFSWSR